MKYLLVAFFIAVLVADVIYAEQGVTELEKTARKQCCDDAGYEDADECERLMIDPSQNTDKCWSHCVGKTVGLVGEDDCDFDQEKLDVVDMPEDVKEDVKDCLGTAKGSSACSKCSAAYKCVIAKREGEQKSF